MKAINRIAIAILTPALLTGAAATFSASAAHADDITTLQAECLQLGEHIGPGGPEYGEIPTTQVQYGSTGVCVKAVQALIDAESWYCSTDNGAWSTDLAIDGDDGPMTTSAVKCIQTLHHLQVDGQVGPYTWTAIWDSAG
jgi:peptidoglycan hydrolase-like protein with peptidoglycan-binding domain